MQSIVDYMPPRNAPARLYHYTNQAGLLGILKSKSLWSTRIDFLNDSREFHYSLNLLEKTLRHRAGNLHPLETKRPDTLRRATERKILATLRGELRFARETLKYVACFSKNPDSLSQWRGYCAGGGFSIGFSFKQLQNIPGRVPSEILPCIYNVAQQSKLANTLFDIHIPNLRRHPPDGARWENACTAAWMDMVTLSTALKHRSFAHEEEWRVVTGPCEDTDPEIDIRPGRLLPIPYFDLKLTKTTEVLEIEIVVGPSPHIDLACNAAKVLLDRFNCYGTVRKSKIPYREI
jgi:hypothetical protein